MIAHETSPLPPSCTPEPERISLALPRRVVLDRRRPAYVGRSLPGRASQFAHGLVREAGYGVFVHYLSGLQNDAESINSQGQETAWDDCVRESPAA